MTSSLAHQSQTAQFIDVSQNYTTPAQSSSPASPTVTRPVHCIDGSFKSPRDTIPDSLTVVQPNTSQLDDDDLYSLSPAGEASFAKLRSCLSTANTTGEAGTPDVEADFIPETLSSVFECAESRYSALHTASEDEVQVQSTPLSQPMVDGAGDQPIGLEGV